VKVPFVPSGDYATERWGGMDLDLHFYWTTADTIAALVSAGGAIFVLTCDRIYRRLVKR
jgi:hypothetical protein